MGERLQAQLLRAQKMDSIGRLAGGIAHDFKDMIQTILGNTAIEELVHADPIRDNLQGDFVIMSVSDDSVGMEPETLDRAVEPAILRTAQTALDRLGYEVLATSSPRAGVKLAQQHDGDVDLLITDVVMPELTVRSGLNGCLQVIPDSDTCSFQATRLKALSTMEFWMGQCSFSRSRSQSNPFRRRSGRR